MTTLYRANFGDGTHTKGYPDIRDAKLACAVCGEPATCIGAYEGQTEESPACDACCGHGCEDGKCTPIDGDAR
jgi:hypothetical protein